MAHYVLVDPLEDHKIQLVPIENGGEAIELKTDEGEAMLEAVEEFEPLLLPLSNNGTFIAPDPFMNQETLDTLTHAEEGAPLG